MATDEVRPSVAAFKDQTWAPPLGAPAVPPSHDGVRRTIFEEASAALGQEVPYPGDEAAC